MLSDKEFHIQQLQNSNDENMSPLSTHSSKPLKIVSNK